MKGDFTRNTFDPLKHFSRVLMQQGRVQLDADWNEQAAILLHYLQTLTADLIGPHAGPPGAWGFKIIPDANGEKDFSIGPGRYYVDGILCENEARRDEDGNAIMYSYFNQPDYQPEGDLPDALALVYLDVWERHLTHIQEPSIREVALGGPDTATRAKTIWQVKTQAAPAGMNTCPSADEWMNIVENWQPRYRGLLKAQAREFDVEDDNEPCTISPESKYRGAENQLYRVEIHTSGEGGRNGTATFKWSRENGSVVFPILRLNGSQATLAHLGRDDRFSLREGDWVEIVDDDRELRGEALPLLQVGSIDRDRLTVSLEVPETTDLPVYDESSTSHPLLRRWDHQALDPDMGYPEMVREEGALRIMEDDWLLLEDGIQIYFEPAPRDNVNHYRSGDYWLIPARTATGDVEWPGPADNPTPQRPHGVIHHYAPLAIIGVAAAGIQRVVDCRCTINTLITCEER